MFVHRNAQHRELKLPESPRFVLNTVLMVAVSTCGPTSVSHPPLSSQNIQSHEKCVYIKLHITAQSSPVILVVR